MVTLIFLPLILGSYYCFFYGQKNNHPAPTASIPGKQLPLNKNTSRQNEVKAELKNSSEVDALPLTALRGPVVNYHSSTPFRKMRQLHLKANLQEKKVTPASISRERRWSSPAEEESINSGNSTVISIPTDLHPPGEKNPLKTDSSHSTETIQLAVDDDKFSMELFVSPILPVNHMSSVDKSYEALLRRSARMLGAFNLGLRMKYHFSERIAAKIGVQYTRIGLRFNPGNSSGNQYGNKNVYTSFSVPLLVTYKTGLLSLSDLSINTGVLVNVISKYNGIVPGAGGQAINISSNHVYNKNASAAFYLGVDYSREMKDRAEVFVEPWFAFRLASMTNRFYGFDQRIHNCGISLGWRYRLFKNPFLQSGN
jgi:hypothetical protein